jgi:hypothetical protein
MMTALLLALTYKPLEVANDVGPPRAKEGRNFPPPAPHPSKPKASMAAWAGRIGIVFTIAGAALLGLGTASWAFDPDGRLHIQTASLSFTLPVGVKQ